MCRPHIQFDSGTPGALGHQFRFALAASVSIQRVQLKAERTVRSFSNIPNHFLLPPTDVLDDAAFSKPQAIRQNKFNRLYRHVLVMATAHLVL